MIKNILVMALSFLCGTVFAGQGSSKAVEPVVQTEPGPAQSLYAYCNIAPCEHASKDVKSLLAKQFLARKKWLYKEPHSQGVQLFDIQNNEIAQLPATQC